MPTGCNSSLGQACKLTAEPKDGVVWNSICIRYADEGKDKPGEEIDVCTAKEKTDFLAEITKQKKDFSDWLCAKAQKDHRERLAKALACIDQKDANLPLFEIEAKVEIKD